MMDGLCGHIQSGDTSLGVSAFSRKDVRSYFVSLGYLDSVPVERCNRFV